MEKIGEEVDKFVVRQQVLEIFRGILENPYLSKMSEQLA